MKKIGLLILLIFLMGFVIATTNTEVYDYNGMGIRSKINYSLFDAKNISATQYLCLNSSCISAWAIVDTSWLANWTAFNDSWSSTYNQTTNDSINNYILSNNGSVVNYIAIVNTSMQNYVNFQNQSQTNLINLNNESVNSYIGSNNQSIVNWVNDSRVPYTGAYKNIDLGAQNITTTGYGQFSWIDKLAQDVAPATPGLYILRLWVEFDAISGFSTYRYKDSGGMVRRMSDNVVIGKNTGASAIPSGSVVYSCGSFGLGAYPLLCLARADNISTMPSIGVTIEAVPAGSYGRVMSVGVLENVNTNLWNSNQPLYVSDTQAGNMTTIPPLTPNFTQEVGTVLVKSATVGKIELVARSLTGNEFGTVNNFTVAGNLTAPNICYSNGTNCNTTNSSYMTGTNFTLQNTSMKNYVDFQNTSQNNYIAYANTTIMQIMNNGSYLNYPWNATNTSYMTGDNFTLQNTSMKNYVDSQNTSQTNLINLNNASMNNWITQNNGSIVNYIAVVNTSMNNSVKTLWTYVDTQNTSQTNYINLQNTSVTNSITANNASMNNYVNSQDSAYNTSNNNYIVANNQSVTNSITANNASINSYISSNNASVTNWATGAFVDVTGDNMSGSLNVSGNLTVGSDVDVLDIYYDGTDIIFNASSSSKFIRDLWSQGINITDRMAVNNGSIVNYIAVVNTSQTNYNNAQNTSNNNYIVSANTTIMQILNNGSYLNAAGESDPLWTGNVSIFNASWLSTYNSTVNDSIKNYIVSSNTTMYQILNNGSYLNAAGESDPYWTGNVTAFNASWLTTYNSTVNDSIKNYILSNNGSVVNYIAVVNTTMMQILNNGSYFNTLSWSNIINGTVWSWTTNGTIWSWVMNGTMAKSSELNNGTYVIASILNNGSYLNYAWNATNTSYLEIKNWNATNTSYMEGSNFTLQNTSMVNYIAVVNTSQTNYGNWQNTSVTNALATKLAISQWNATNTSYMEGSNFTLQNISMVNYIATVNTSMKNYVDLQNGSIVNWVSNTYNTTRNNYVASVNTSMKNYADTTMTAQNTSQTNYINAQNISVTNALATKLNLAGGTMTGNLNFSANINITFNGNGNQIGSNVTCIRIKGSTTTLLIC
jgi:hypothetical protein